MMNKKLKNKIERVRRQLEKNIAIAKKNGWSIRDGIWFADGEVCPFGAVIAAHEKVSAPGDFTKLDEKFDPYSNLATEEAAKLCSITKKEVESFIAGFDNMDWDEPGYPYSDNTQAFYRLGVRLAKKHLGR